MADGRRSHCVLLCGQRGAGLGEKVALGQPVLADEPDDEVTDVSALDVSWMIEQFARTAPPAGASDDDRNVQQRLLAIAIDGLRAAGADPLPGHPPTTQHYEQRWQSPRAPG